MGARLSRRPRGSGLGFQCDQSARGELDGFLFVFPEYNWGYPGVLKNALDYLYDEWRGKPASLFTYGTRGGNKAAAQFVIVLNDPGWQLIGPEATLAPTRPQLTAINAQLARALTAVTGPGVTGT
jgi:NAD(P)H-dependent FMN reductase